MTSCSNHLTMAKFHFRYFISNHMDAWILNDLFSASPKRQYIHAVTSGEMDLFAFRRKCCTTLAALVSKKHFQQKLASKMMLSNSSCVDYWLFSFQYSRLTTDVELAKQKHLNRQNLFCDMKYSICILMTYCWDVNM